VTAAVATGGRHAARDGSYRRSLVFAAGRAALVVGAAVLLGVVVLQATDNSKGPTPVRASATTSSTSSRFVSSPSSTRGSTTSTTGAERKPAELHVLVLNASGKNGVAGTLADHLKALGYQQTNPKADTAKQVQAATVVLFKPGLDREARTLAKAVGPSVTTGAYPSSPPGPVPANADLVVVVGSR